MRGVSMARYETTREAALRLAEQCTTTDLPTAGAFFGMGINASYEAHRRGEFPCRVFSLGRKFRVSTADLLATLGLTADGELVSPNGGTAA
jgi:hypothetical protein